jgi:hypothetical protein
MQPLLTSLPCVFVSTIFCLWSHYHLAQLRRQCRLHERVAMLLWTAANQAA